MKKFLMLFAALTVAAPALADTCSSQAPTCASLGYKKYTNIDCSGQRVVHCPFDGDWVYCSYNAPTHTYPCPSGQVYVNGICETYGTTCDNFGTDFNTPSTNEHNNISCTEGYFLTTKYTALGAGILCCQKQYVYTYIDNSNTSFVVLLNFEGQAFGKAGITVPVTSSDGSESFIETAYPDNPLTFGSCSTGNSNSEEYGNDTPLVSSYTVGKTYNFTFADNRIHNDMFKNCCEENSAGCQNVTCTVTGAYVGFDLSSGFCKGASTFCNNLVETNDPAHYQSGTAPFTISQQIDDANKGLNVVVELSCQ